MNYYIFHTEGDFTPVVFCTDNEIIKQGDSIHEYWLFDYAKGYTDDLNVELKDVEIYKKEQLKEYESILKNLDIYDEFKSYEQFLL